MRTVTLLAARPPAAAAADRRRVAERPARPGLGQPEEGLAVALRARAARTTRSRARAAPARGAAPATATSAARRSAGLAHHAALADALAADLELRLDHGQRVEARRGGGQDRGQDLGQRDERDVGDDEVGPVGQLGGVQRAGVAALEHGDALVGRAALQSSSP